MDASLKCSPSKLKKKPERKIIEKNRRNQMKFLYSHLFSLIPPNYLPKVGDMSDRVDSAIEYIQTLKTNLDIIKNKKDKLPSRNGSHKHTKMINNVCKPIDIQIHEMSHDTDAVLVTGLKIHSKFRDVVWFLNQCTTEVTLANFSCCGHSIFHIRQKKVGAEAICKRVKSLIEGSLNVKELENNYALFCTNVTLPQPRWGSTGTQPREIEELQMNFQKELSFVSSSNELDYESNISIWDFDFQSNLYHLCDILRYEIHSYPMHSNVYHNVKTFYPKKVYHNVESSIYTRKIIGLCIAQPMDVHNHIDFLSAFE
ncbi:achaete-scute transcription factor-related protein [Artemisia annua]|uniref:Achaete-scute transcription factor-related protein n=1 Tax=Artemisia annua TaxID=35608 RepID=A0A2U1P4R0_ARTAN|nr:achaete-scute transcription factor-related protein [Artemisia annua]